MPVAAAEEVFTTRLPVTDWPGLRVAEAGVTVPLQPEGRIVCRLNELAVQDVLSLFFKVKA